MAALLQHSLDMKRRFVLALGISIIYAITDEVHQLFVHGRGGQFSDVCIDAGGALIGVLLVLLVHKLTIRTGPRG
jgi:VanZ family protein